MKNLNDFTELLSLCKNIYYRRENMTAGKQHLAAKYCIDNTEYGLLKHITHTLKRHVYIDYIINSKKQKEKNAGETCLREMS